MKFLYLILFFFMAIVSCKEDHPEEYDYSVDKKLTIENQSYGNNSRNVMDIYLSMNRTTKTPAVIFIHGGGWKEGDKSDFKDFASLVSDYGINTVAINYRYADTQNGIGYSEILTDIETAILFLKSNSEKYGSNFTEVTLLGASAGGHLALLYAYKLGNIKNVISLAGPTDFNDVDILSIDGMPELINNVAGSDSYEKRSEASPVTYANGTTTFLYHGKQDIIVPCTQSEKLFSKIVLLNSENKLTLFPNCGHEFNDEALFKVFQETINLVKK